LAARRGCTVERYTDEAEGLMRKNEAGKIAVTLVSRHPCTEFTEPRQPTHEAHEACFIASSVKTEIRVEPVPDSR